MTGSRRMRIILRLAFFLIAGVALATVCRQGSSLTVVRIVLAVYVLAALLWVFGQHRASIDAVTRGGEGLRPLPPMLSGLAVLGGALLAAYGVWRDNGTALIFGVLVAYLFAGYVLMAARLYSGDGARRRIVAGTGVLGGVTLVVVIGLLLLEESGWYVIPVGFIALAPIGLSLLAEPAIRKLHGPSGDRELIRALSLGAGLLLLAIVVAYLRVDATKWILPAVVGLTLLVFAIVSNTLADIAVVIAAVALMGLTPGSDEKPDVLTPKPADANVLVALGDSYMSGEGADVYYEEKDDDEHENHCHRAPTAWAVKAVTEKKLFDSVAFLACSGARTYHVRHKSPPLPKPEPRKQYNEPGTQLDQVHALDLEPSLVVVSLGGNDAGFSTIGMMCLAPGDCSKKRSLWEDNLPSVASALSVTYDQIRDEFPTAPVLVAGYPAPIHTSESCDDVALSKGDMSFVSDFVKKLNDTVDETATSKGFHFLDLEPALADEHLQLCDPDNDGRPGLNFIGLRSVGGFAEQRFNPANWYHNSLHPNERGHAAMLEVFARWRAENLNPARVAAKEGEIATTSAPPDPPCDLWKNEESTRSQCDEDAATWVRGQIRNSTLFWGLWGPHIALATAGAWLLAVAFFGWRKPWWPARPTPPDDNPA